MGHPVVWRLTAMIAAGVLCAPTLAGAIDADPNVARGVRYLQASGGANTGESALKALALIKAEVPASDPMVADALGKIRARFSGSNYRPESGGGPDVYEASVTLMALANLDPVAYRAEIEGAARHILSKQKPNGSWDYDFRSAGDTSISQYAVLGLWEADNVGFAIEPEVWNRAARWFIGTQSPVGSWNYHRDESGPETMSMTAAGTGSLLICFRQLAPFRNLKPPNPLLIPVTPEAGRRTPTDLVAEGRLAGAIRGGLNWLTRNFSTSQPDVVGHSPYYALYGIERIGALADQATLGKQNWFEDGRRFLAATQQSGGNWTATYGDGPNTAWGVLFLTKSTAKSVRKLQLRRLGAGTLIGGRGLPADLSQISVAGGRVVARPMDGAVEGMLAVLEDPRVVDAASALAGLVARYQVDGSKALRPHEARFHKLLSDPDQGVRRVAAWGLARTGELGVAPDLISALRDPDPGVRDEARDGLQLLSRRIDGFGPPRDATPDQVEAAVKSWRAWYEGARPAGSPPLPPDPGPNRRGP
ncbi:HEAT repeat domain-containing protein [Tundrisphaera sp. TA3]|uniref:HEAT repeat domain-containing protein n=1 Tax=Tundrisphaera sp. TA3 TaxID=3435775 RepID=UPI003EB8F9C7